MREWSTLTVPPGQHIPLGLLAGQLCSRVLAPRNIGQALKLSQDAPLVSRREWDEGWSRLGQEWASKIRCEPVSTAALAEAFRPVQPKAGVSDLKRYPDYHGKLSDYVTDPVLKERAVNGGIVGLGALLASLVVAPLLL